MSFTLTYARYATCCGALLLDDDQIACGCIPFWQCPSCHAIIGSDQVKTEIKLSSKPGNDKTKVIRLTEPSINTKYKEVDIEQTKHVVAKLAASAEPPSCPICKGEMSRRTGRYGDFWGCKGYPKCKGTINIKWRNE
jgi:ribosomal protein L37AE/L43A